MLWLPVLDAPCERRIFAVPVSYALAMPLITLLLTHSSYRSRTGDFAVKGQRLDHLTNEPNTTRPLGIGTEKHGFGDHAPTIDTGA